MKPRRPVTLSRDDRTILVHMTSGAVIRLRPSELVGWVVGDLKLKRRNLINLTKQLKVASSKSSAQKPKAKQFRDQPDSAQR